MPLNRMKMTVKTTTLNNEQMKFLSQLGMFLDDDMWEAGCDADEFDEAMDRLRWAGIVDVFVEFGP